MIKKINIARMAALGAVLFGMTACGHKAEAENSEAVAQDEAGIESVEPADGEDTVFDASSQDYTTTASGLKYRVIKEGTGNKPSATDIVEVNYEGKLTDGTVFDSSYDRGESIEFPLNRVIAGWTEGLQLMPEGSIYEFYIPYDLAYGEKGGGPIPPKSDLIFTVELIKVKK